MKTSVQQLLIEAITPHLPTDAHMTLAQALVWDLLQPHVPASWNIKDVIYEIWAERGPAEAQPAIAIAEDGNVRIWNLRIKAWRMSTASEAIDYLKEHSDPVSCLSR